ncbi:MAG: arginine--tRNA ligase [Phycisphaerae bacterium]|nr:arginine--tRNA ligase [Phycisphaerae bacterium]MDD5380999.1 arginine--tRNA ligase [Phycisphaerae bacterium]
MKPVITILEDRISAAMAAAVNQEDCRAQVCLSTDPKFGDYQVNGVMALAKQLKTNPRKLAEQIVAKLDIGDICEKPEIAGPGFINLRVKPEYVAAGLLEVNKDAKRLGIEKADKPKNIVVDFSGPNIAKQMHVGHLRSTILGDCVCRLLELEDHTVIRQNHIGDWGTQFGMLIAGIYKWWEGALVGKRTGVMPTHLHEFEDLYREAKQEYDTNEEFRSLSRAAIADLHAGDKTWLGRWQVLVKQSKEHYQQLYERLNVTLKEEHVRGESAYREDLPNVVADLKKVGLAKESDGAICVFPEGFKDKEGNPLPVIIQKSDGAYLYATTDLAAIRYRVGELKADKIIYVTDARQQLHFEMVFAVARMAGWVKPETELVHVTFGSVLGENGKPLKTRSGENVKLKELLDEAVERAHKVVNEKNSELSDDEKDKIAKAVGIGAVKYADYSNNRTSDYIFSFDKMLAMEGNTAPYMQYAYARIKSIVRKAPEKGVDVGGERVKLDKLILGESAELDLAKHLVRYSEAIEAAAIDYRPNYLTSYLYELAQKFSVFYTNCPVLVAGSDKTPTRLLLCDLTAKTIRHGLSNLLGIEVVDQM